MLPSKPLPTILLTGFEPFGGEASNPSWEAVRPLHGRRIAGHRVVARRLPVVFGKSLQVLHSALCEHDPVLVVCVGQAGGRSAVSFERIAINVDDARIPDNAGAAPVDTQVVAGGPAAYFSTLPIKAMGAAVRAAGIPAEVSQTAGTYVCNHVFYGLMHALQGQARTRGGFVHIPFSPDQAAARPGAAALCPLQVTEALRIALRVAVATQVDQRVAAGAEH
jgi:pyroglutamyl-peptidase